MRVMQTEINVYFRTRFNYIRSRKSYFLNRAFWEFHKTDFFLAGSRGRKYVNRNY